MNGVRDRVCEGKVRRARAVKETKAMDILIIIWVEVGQVDLGKVLRKYLQLVPLGLEDIEGSINRYKVVGTFLKSFIASSQPVSYTHLTLPTILLV